MAQHEITRTSLLAASPERVYARVMTFEGINDELWPLLRMTAPREVRERGLAAVTLGERVCRSWILLFGVVPIDYDDVTLVRVEPGRGFLERSPMGSQRSWEHERTIEGVGGGCRITDRVRFETRLPVGRAFREVLKGVFWQRHRRLRGFFGEVVDAEVGTRGSDRIGGTTDGRL